MPSGENSLLHSRMSALVVRPDGRYITLKTARKNNLSGISAVPGEYINLDTGKAVSKKSATALLQNGGNVLLSQDDRWFPMLGKIVNRAERIPLTLPKELTDVISAEDLKMARSLKASFGRKHLNAWDRIDAWVQLAVQMDEKYGEQVLARRSAKYKKGESWTAVVNATFTWTETDSTGKTYTVPENPKPENVLDTVTLDMDLGDDMALAKAVVEEYLTKRFKRDSPPEYVIHSISNIRTGLVDKLEEMPMGSVKAIYKGIRVDVRDSQRGQCVFDYMLWEASKIGSRKSWTRPYLVNRLGEQPTTLDIIEFAESQRDVSVYALDPLLKVFMKHISTEKTRVSLFFIVNDGHCYPITSPEHRRQITTTSQLVLSELPNIKDALKSAQYIDSEDPEEIVERLNSMTGTAIVPLDSLHTVANECMRRTNALIDCIKETQGEIKTFKHPVQDLVVISGKDFYKRKSIMDGIVEEHNVEDFQFANQSWGVIGRMLLDTFFANIPKSQYSPVYMKILKEYSITPYRGKERDAPGERTSVDIRRCYSSILKNTKGFSWYALNGWETDVEYDGGDIVPGEYLIDSVMCCGRTMKLGRGWYPHNVIQALLDKRIITKRHIKRQLKASRQIAPDVFVKFLEHIETTYPTDGKNIVNAMIGILGISASTKVLSGATCDLETAMRTVANIIERGNEGNIIPMDDFNIVSETQRTWLNEGFMPIYRQVIGESIVKLIEMYNAIVIPGKTVVLGYNTDSIKVAGKFNKRAVKDKQDCAWGDYHIEKTGQYVVCNGFSAEEHPDKPEWVSGGIVNQVLEDDAVSVLSKEGGLILGMGGCGKSYMMAEIWKKVDGRKVGTAYSHKACCNLREYSVDMATVTALLWNPKTMREDITKLKDIDWLLIDEVFMIPSDTMRLICLAQKRYGFKVICAGDYQQTSAISGVKIRYDTHPTFLEMVGWNVVECSYKQGFARYDSELYGVITQFLESGRLPAMPEWDGVVPLRNLCYTNNTRQMVNTIVRDAEAQRLGKELVDVNGLLIFEGMPLMCYHETDFKNAVYKTEEVLVVQIGDSEVVLLKEDGSQFSVNYEFLSKAYDYVYCATVHKYQGGKINGRFCIWDSQMMSRNLLYTAISRGTRLQDVMIVSPMAKDYIWESYDNCFDCRQVKTDVAVRATGYVYKITCADGWVYVGITERSVDERFQEHQMNPSPEMAKHINEMAFVDVLEQFSFTDRAVLLEKETEYIKMYAGENLINVQKLLKEETPKVEVVPKMKNGKQYKPSYDKSKNRWIVRLKAQQIPPEMRNKNFKTENDAVAYCKMLQENYTM